MAEIFDILICGAGPAGSTCALALGNSGLKVALIEKAVFPRDKTCGDAVANYVPKVLNTINPLLVKELGGFAEKETVNTIRIVAPNEKFLDFPCSENGFISKRLHFDNFLFEQVAKLPNVKVFLNSTIQNVSVKNHVVRVEGNGFELEASLVIGCDGANGIISKKLSNNKVDLKHHSGAVRAYYKNVKGIPDKTFELHFLKNILPGYFWIFPLPDNQANVGLGMLSSSISKRKLSLRDKMKEIIESEPALKERFANAEIISPVEGHGLPLGSRKVTISGERFMLCGDAASLIDPLTGEGIGQAIISGRYAGWQAAKCFKENNFSASFMKQYDKMVYDKLWKPHQKRYLVQRMINEKTWPINMSINLANKNKVFYRLIKSLI